jgi:hypothetical protein
MKNSVLIAAAIAATFSSVAMAGGVKQHDNSAVPAVTAQVLSDSELDRVTAAGVPVETGRGFMTAQFAGASVNPPPANVQSSVSVQPGGGIGNIGTGH